MNKPETGEFEPGMPAIATQAELVRLEPAELAAFLSEGLPQPLSLVVTRNRISLIRLRPLADGRLELRTHACLLQAPPEVLRALKRFLLSHRKSDWRTVCGFIQNTPRDNGPHRATRVRTAGKVHDLHAILDQVNASYFPGPCPCKITWGREGSRPRRRTRRHIAYGSYHREPGLIRIHPLLDDARVPPEFVSFIVYHERLHAELGAECRGTRQCHHTATFRHRERQYPDFNRLQELARSLFKILDKPEPKRSWTDVFRLI
jgi:hypothetical protein